MVTLRSSPRNPRNQAALVVYRPFTNCRSKLQLRSDCTEEENAFLDALERQGRSALLSAAVISAILGQLTVNVTYDSMRCYTALPRQLMIMAGPKPVNLFREYHAEK
ncbi:hypothetical protein KIN20_022060 [Parelaphostrongylus tenuis]|uniref:Uncharacterized protein n=1 Tax=Parelaphostrongylus tenuis TaxID=148309 RepID=A0AAD5MUZ2_PARTN|nr:hypothetical protein KIN20_022060 [Parelaphostrongylus tenuis]